MNGVALYRFPLLLALSGCFYVNDGRFNDQVEDADGDGGVGDRFDGPDCVDNDPAIADCDVDGDGYLTTAAGGDDCDDEDASIVPGTFWFHDVDGDGHGDPEDFTSGCGPAPVGWSLSDADCDDANASVSPEADERCDPLDRNCDGDPFATAADATIEVYVDADEDGYGKDDSDPYTVCAPGPGEALQAGDCDDADPQRSPAAKEVFYNGVDNDCDDQNENDADGDGFDDLDHGGDDCDDTRDDVFPLASEQCDGVDNDCDDLVDADDPDQSATDLFTFHLDADGDGFGGSTTADFCIGGAAKDYVLSGADCNDGSDAMFPGAVEWCNDVDDNCNGVTDEGTAVDAFTAYFDNDQDGWGGQGLTVCEIAPVDYDGDAQIDVLTMRGGDCGNNDPDVHPGAQEVCGDSIRQDCSTADPDDCDSDGFLANDPQDPDCDDDPAGGGPAVHPGQKETCDGFDNDCDGKIDADDPDVLSTSYPDWYLDADRDGHGSPVIVATKTCAPPDNAAPTADDCDDLRNSVHPGADERCDGYDNDCNKTVDDDPVDLELLYEDVDHDGFGAQYSEERCPGALGWSGVNTDCDDDDDAISPGAPEVCADLIDNDCDNLVDGLDPNVAADEIWYPDDDKDGVGAGIGLASCGKPAGDYADLAGDCNDDDALEQGPALWFADLDQDGFAGTLGVQYSCKPSTPTSWLPVANDCNDAVKDVHPGAVDGCNLRDDDCDGTLDNNAPSNDPGVKVRYTDADNDGWGTGSPTFSCFETAGADKGGDCSDTTSTVNPGQKENCNDALDNNCDNQVDEGCTINPPQCMGWKWPDPDSDTFGSMDANPTHDCTGADFPEDNSPSVGTFVSSATATDGVTIVGIANGTFSAIIHLTNTGPYFLPSAINVQTNNKIAIVADIPGTVLFAPPSQRIVDATNADSTLILQNVRLQGPTTFPDLIHTSSGTRVLLVNSTIDGQNTVGGIFAQGGYLGLFGVLFDHTSAPAQGSALTADASTQLTMQETSVRECTGTAPYSIQIDGSSNRTIDRLSMVRSKPLAFINGLAGNTMTVNDLEVWDAVGSGLYYQTQASDLVVTRALIARPTDRGIDGSGASGTMTIKNATIVRTANQGIFSAGPLFLGDSFLLDTGTVTQRDAAAPSGSLQNSYVARPGAQLIAQTNPITSPPLFVTYNKALRSNIPTLPPQFANQELWDLHLRELSPGKAPLIGPAEDVGYYNKTDPYYQDTLNGGNGVPDGWEQRWFGGPMPGNSDADALTNLDEFDFGTCPLEPNTDGTGGDDVNDLAPLDPNAP